MDFIVSNINRPTARAGNLSLMTTTDTGATTLGAKIRDDATKQSSVPYQGFGYVPGGSTLLVLALNGDNQTKLAVGYGGYVR